VRKIKDVVMSSTRDRRSPLRLHEHEQRYRLLVEELRDFAVFMLDPDGRIASWNAGAERILGYGEKEILGHPLARIFTPEDVEAGVPQRELKTAAAEGRADDDRWHMRKDGSRFWAAGSTTAYRDADGNLIGFAKIVRDGTIKRQVNEALRESEARYRLLADLMPQIVWTARPDGWRDYYNRRWFHYTGLTLEQTQGWGWTAAKHPDDAQRCVERWKQAVRTGEPYEIEYRYRRADGTYCWHLGRALPVKDDAGNVLKWFGTCTDIHGQKQAEAERDDLLAREKAARLDAEAANRLKDEFLSVVSHELRTPLNSVLGWVQLLRVSSPPGSETGEGLAVIERNTRAQTRLIDDLLDVSRITAGKLRLDVAPVELSRIIEAAAASVRVAAEAKGVALKLDLDPATGAVQGDADRLQQVVWNLLANAVKFTPKGGSVTVRLERVHSHVVVRVRDTGEGVSPSLLPYVFDRFRQGESARSHGGLGLGLAIVRHLVELHGGTVMAESGGEGQGATFTLSLPLMAVSHEQTDVFQQHPQATERGQSGEMSRNLDGVRVLVVEDEPDSRAMVVKALKACGAVVASAANAAEAMAAIQQSKPDVMVCDVGIPDEDGYSFIRRVRALDAEHGGLIPAVALTGYAGLEDRRKALAAGFQMHLAKPVTLTELSSVVGNLAGRAGPA
jgi:PAS domain S-box-containing protein